jgi:hypothetical protein
MSGYDSPVRKLRATGCTCLKNQTLPVVISSLDDDCFAALISQTHPPDLQLGCDGISNTETSLPSMSAVPATEAQGAFLEWR